LLDERLDRHPTSLGRVPPKIKEPLAGGKKGRLAGAGSGSTDAYPGALGVPAASAPQPVDQTAAHKSGDWAIQFAAQKSEAEAKVNVARFNAKYAAALNGATIGVNKTLVNGETIYALRVTGLSKAEAAALCERLKGRDCFIAK
jgi:hypothetical protein